MNEACLAAGHAPGCELGCIGAAGRLLHWTFPPSEHRFVVKYLCNYCNTRQDDAGKCDNCGGQTEPVAIDDPAANTQPAFVGIGIVRSGSPVAVGNAAAPLVVGAVLLGGLFAVAGWLLFSSLRDAVPAAGSAQSVSPEAHVAPGEPLTPQEAARLSQAMHAAMVDADSPAIRPYVMQAQLAQTLASVAPIRMMALQYQAMNGAYPASFAELGLDPSQMNDAEHIDSVHFGDGGRIVVALSERFGTGHKLALVPIETMGGLRTKWTCQTTLSAADLGPQPREICSPVSESEFSSAFAAAEHQQAE